MPEGDTAALTGGDARWERCSSICRSRSFRESGLGFLEWQNEKVRGCGGTGTLQSVDVASLWVS